MGFAMTRKSTLSPADRAFLRALAFAFDNGSTIYEHLERLCVETPSAIADAARREMLMGRTFYEALLRALVDHPGEAAEFRELVAMVHGVSAEPCLDMGRTPVKIACLLLALEGQERRVTSEAIIEDLRKTEARRDRSYLLFTIKHALEGVAA